MILLLYFLIMISPMIGLLILAFIVGYRTKKERLKRIINFLLILSPISLIAVYLTSYMGGFMCTIDGGSRCTPDIISLLRLTCGSIGIGLMVAYIGTFFQHMNTKLRS